MITEKFKVLNHGLALKKVQSVIKLDQKAWLKSYIDMNAKLRKKKSTNIAFKLMNNEVFGKTVENIRKKNEDIKLLTTEPRRNYLVSELNYHTLKAFSENVLAIEIKKKKEKKSRKHLSKNSLFRYFNISK